MSIYSAEELEPNKKKGKEIKEPVEKKDCKDCGNTRSCEHCRLKVKVNTDRMKAISLTLSNAMKNKWIGEKAKTDYLQELQGQACKLYMDL